MKHYGIIGGGQLGRMLALAGVPLGLKARVLEPTLDAPAAIVAEQVVGAYDDAEALAQFALGLDVITYEFENVPVEAAQLLARDVPVFPPPAALEAAQDRLSEKSLFLSLGIETAPFRAVERYTELEAAVADIGLPSILKTRRFGYDGKGQFVLRTPADCAAAWAELSGQPLILEGFVPFQRELSIIAVRGRDGATASYPLIENQHRDGILRLSRAPASDVPIGLQALAESYAARVMDALGYVGVLAIELFQLPTTNGTLRLLANEMAPRVHNSGHWTIEGAETSQFENHLRAVLGLPLGQTMPRGAVAMINLIGTLPDCDAVLAIPGAHLHLYGKEPRPGRKLGHVTLLAETSKLLDKRLARLQALVRQ